MLRIALRMLKMLGFRGAAPDPAGGASAHPRPPSLSFIALRLWHSAQSVSQIEFQVSPTTGKFWFDALLSTPLATR